MVACNPMDSCRSRFRSQARSMAKKEIQGHQRLENAKALRDDLPFMVLLRPFSVDGRLSVKVLTRGTLVDAELLLRRGHNPDQPTSCSSVQPELQLRIIGGEPIGPGVVKTDDSKWRERFFSLMKVAPGIIMIALPGREIPWELHQLRIHGWLAKSIFLLPPIASTGRYDASDSWFMRELRADGFDLPSPDERKPITIMFRISESERAVQSQSIDQLDYWKLREILREHSLMPSSEEGYVTDPHTETTSLADRIGRTPLRMWFELCS